MQCLVPYYHPTIIGETLYCAYLTGSERVSNKLQALTTSSGETSYKLNVAQIITSSTEVKDYEISYAPPFLVLC